MNGPESVWEIQRAENYTDNGGGWGPDSFDGTGTPVAVACGGWNNVLQGICSNNLRQETSGGNIQLR